MLKALLCILPPLLAQAHLVGFERLPAVYQISYGSLDAPLRVVEYLSLSCPKCLDAWNTFKTLRPRYVASHQVHWTFHLHPADMLTLQALVCLHELPPTDRTLFFEVLLDTLEDPTEGCLHMQIAMEALGKPLPELDRIPYLKTTESFKTACTYLKQPDVVTELPTVEINGTLYDAFPNLKFLEKQFTALQRKPL